MTKVNDDTFAMLVANDVKNKLMPNEREVLLDAKNWDRWKRALLALIENLDHQINEIDAACALDVNRFKALGRDGKKLVDESQRIYADRRTKVERFKGYVNRRLDQVMAMIESGQPIENNPWELAELLRKAILRHRALMSKHDLEATAIDNALWDTLEGKWSFDSIDESTL